MEPEPANKTFRLLDAAIRWCDPVFVEAIRRAESRLTAHETEQSGLPLLSSTSALMKPSSQHWMAGGPSYVAISAAWSNLERDFRKHLEQSALFLAAVPVTAELKSQHVPIDSVWAAELKFDWNANTLFFRKQKYVSIKVSRQPFPQVLNTDAMPRQLNPEGVHLLTDDVILALLEEHIRRVVESPEPKMMARIKDVLQPIIIRRLEARAKAGDMMDTLAGEARNIQSWIKQVASWHPTPAEKTVENNIRDRYKALKPRSKATI